MKIQNTPAAAMVREWPKANKAEAGTETATNAGRPNTPPGLERVVAKFEARAAEGKTPGQSQALDRVSRNLARYQENQALASTPANPTSPTQPPAAEAPAETPTANASAPTPASPVDNEVALLDSVSTPTDATASDASTPSP